MHQYFLDSIKKTQFQSGSLKSRKKTKPSTNFPFFLRKPGLKNPFFAEVFDNFLTIFGRLLAFRSGFRDESNGIFVLGVGFFSSDEFPLFN